MFESSLIDLDARPQSRRKLAPLPIAIALHGIVLASVGVAQVWNVAAVGDPDVVRPYVVTFVPSLGESQAPVSKPVQKPATSRQTTQPDTKQLPDTPARNTESETPVVPTVLNGPVNTGGDEHIGDFGPSNGPFTGPVPSDGPTTPIVPAAAPDKDEVLYVGGAVSRPVVLASAPPRYTKVALRARVEGAVILQALIDENGHVRDLRVLRGLPMGLDQAAVDAVRDWTFEPAKLQGRAVKVYYTLTVNFRLQS